MEYDYLNDDAEYNDEPVRNRYKRLDPSRPQKVKQHNADVMSSLVKMVEGNQAAVVGFNPTYKGSRHERQWIIDALEGFYEDNHITDVVRQVKGGKEATVYCCRAHPSSSVRLIAAKVYRPRMFRQLRNDALYRQGRKVLDEDGKEVLDDGRLHAIVTGTSYGKELVHTSWLSHEFETMRMLHDAGALVPVPYARASNAILMEYMGDEDNAAPTLNQVVLAHDEAQPLFDKLLENVRLMLLHDRIHADFSAYNVLYWQGEVKIIDFPQAINPATNQHAYPILQRDVTRLCQYFEVYGVDADPRKLSAELWAEYVAECNPTLLDSDSEIHNR
ncbi:MAG TPA: RIO1 family regulatory kinase/ATPase [Anaerolineae bacterium]